MKPELTPAKGLPLCWLPDRLEALAAQAACDSMNRPVRTRMPGGVGGGAGNGPTYPIRTLVASNV